MTRSCRTPALVVLLAAAGCNYSFRAGSFPPEHIRNVAVVPFDNETTRFELTQELFDRMLRELPGALGINRAGEDVADAVIRGTITRYSLDAPLFRPGANNERAEVLQRQVTIVVAVEIVDLANNVILWEDRNVTAQGQYLEASETEETGRAEAIELLVQLIVDGAQSNW